MGGIFGRRGRDPATWQGRPLEEDWREGEFSAGFFEAEYRLRAGTETVPRWAFGVLHTRCSALPRSCAGPCRLKLPQSARATEPSRCSGDRRLGARAPNTSWTIGMPA